MSPKKKVPRVAYQGEPGAYSEGSTLEAFLPTGVKVETIGHQTFDDVFNALATGAVEYAAVPVENTLGGSIHVNYDLMLRYHGKVHVVGEHAYRVRHSLLALKGVTKKDIKKAMSHPQALAQTEGYQKAHGIEPVPAYDTAGSAKIVREKGLRDTAAIASARAAEVHGLEVLEYGIEDDPNNFTRFLILAPYRCEMPEDAAAKTSIVFIPKRNEIGVLHKALSCFAQREIGLSKIESRPFKSGDLADASKAPATEAPGPSPAKKARIEPSSSGSPPHDYSHANFEYAFYLDVLSQASSPECQNALRHLAELSRFVKVLGTYPVDGIRLMPASPEVGVLAEAPLWHEPLVSPVRVGIIGFGTFGQFLARRWRMRGHAIFAQSRSDYTAAATSMGVTFVNKVEDLVKHKLDVLVLCTSILSFESVLASLPAALLKDVLVVDVLSVKGHAKQSMLKTLPDSCDILCTHPMFGPDSGKDSWQGLPCTFDNVRITDFHRAARFLSLFENEGCKMVRMTCEEHDTQAAGSQFVTHLTGRILANLDLKQSPIATAGFKALLKLVDTTCSDSFDLFYALYSHNPASSEQLQQFKQAFTEMSDQLTSFESGGGSSSGSNGKTKISDVVNSMALSKTIAVTDKAAQLKNAGKQVLSLSVGEPDILPPPAVMTAAHKALDDGHVRYTECGGLMALRVAICDYLKKDKDLPYKPNQIVCSNGGKQCLLQAMLAVCDPGDEVVVPAPYWVSYTQMAVLARAKSVVISTKEKDGYCLMPEDLEAALTPKSRVLILCNPSNPTGAVHPKALLEKIAAVLRKFPRVIIFADEIYEQITYDEPAIAFASLPGMLERTVIINGFSKGPAMTGFRLGYLAAPAAIASACIKVQSQNTSAPCSVSQHAAIASLVQKDEKWLSDAVAGYRKKRDYVVKRLRAMPGVTHDYEPQGAFYAFPTVHGNFGKKTPDGTLLTDAEGVCLYLLESCLVALVPGEAFGDGNCVRLSYAASMETLKECMDRMEKGFKALKPAKKK